jgi:hypothetical protein
MKQFYKYNNIHDTVRLCKKDMCIEARGQNGKIIVGAFAMLFISIAVYYFSKIK